MIVVLQRLSILPDLRSGEEKSSRHHVLARVLEIRTRFLLIKRREPAAQLPTYILVGWVSKVKAPERAPRKFVST